MKFLLRTVSISFVFAVPLVARADLFDKFTEYTVVPPKPTFDIRGQFGSSGLNGDHPAGCVGTAGLVDMRMHRRWGLWAGTSYLACQPKTRTVVNRVVTLIEPEMAAYFAGTFSSKTTALTHAALALGTSFPIPIYAPALPSVFIGPFMSIGGFVSAASLGRHAVFGFTLDVRGGYRIPLTSGSVSSVDGFFIDARFGVGLAFL